jgi:hypothetical protein
LQDSWSFETDFGKENVMKKFVQSIVITGALTLGVNGLMAAQFSNDGMEQRFQAKYGRPSATEEERLKAEMANTAFREEASQPTAAVNWTEQYFKAKFGRPSPVEEARLKAERDSTAFREEPDTEWPSALSFRNEQFRAKYGRLLGK